MFYEVLEDELEPNCPYQVDPQEEYDAHSCRAEADEFGFCTVCGSIVHGSQADYELHGYDPPDTY